MWRCGACDDEVGEPAVVDLHADAGQLMVVVGSWACRGLGDERDRLQVHRPVEHHAGGDAVVVVVGQPGGRVVVAGRAEVRVVEVAAAREHAWPRVLRRAALAAANRSNSSRWPAGQYGAQVLDEPRPDVGVVGHDDDRRCASASVVGIGSPSGSDCSGQDDGHALPAPDRRGRGQLACRRSRRPTRGSG